MVTLKINEKILINKKTKELGKVLFIIVMFAISLIVLFPFFLSMITSLKTMAEIQSSEFVFFPENLRFENYINAFNKGDWLRYFFNSAFISVSAVVGSLLFNSIAGYAFALLRHYATCLPIR
jgi:multiple sugar transport system permease protein